ncbi:MAG: N-acetylmuramoyl-L-alanine amidase, partial [Muribaculaceae bacterium]|nr:N-acetylmuramoyl-L-alanine amidase [Muribaculaceae bacterium]
MLCLINFSVCIGTEKKDFIVVIDPGHGGHDYGAIGKITNEKTINLNVALQLRNMLQKHDGVTPILTRDNDSYLQLQERADIANKAAGNLFISIHVNSLDKRSKRRNTIEGASVYTLGLHKSAENFDV